MIIFLGDPAGRPPTAKKRPTTATVDAARHRRLTDLDRTNLPLINSPHKSDERGFEFDNQPVSEEKSEAEREFEKFKTSVDERRRVFVDNRNRSIHANKQSTMFDYSWTASDSHSPSIIETAMESQVSGKVWKESATEFLESKAHYDAEKAKNSYKSGRGKPPMLMSELFHQHRHQNPRSNESLLFLKRPFSASTAKIPSDLTALDMLLYNASSDSDAAVGTSSTMTPAINNSHGNSNGHSSSSGNNGHGHHNGGGNGHSNGNSGNHGGGNNNGGGSGAGSRMDSFSSIFSGQDDSRIRSLQRPRTSTGIGMRENTFPTVTTHKSPFEENYPDRILTPNSDHSHSHSIIIQENSLSDRNFDDNNYSPASRPLTKRRGSTEKRSFQQMQLLKGSFFADGVTKKPGISPGSDPRSGPGSGPGSQYNSTSHVTLTPAAAAASLAKRFERLNSNNSNSTLSLNSSTNIPSLTASAAESQKSSNLDYSLYFGENAKVAFFSKFRQLALGLASSTVVHVPTGDYSVLTHTFYNMTLALTHTSISHCIYT